MIKSNCYAGSAEPLLRSQKPWFVSVAVQNIIDSWNQLLYYSISISPCSSRPESIRKTFFIISALPWKTCTYDTLRAASRLRIPFESTAAAATCPNTALGIKYFMTC